MPSYVKSPAADIDLIEIWSYISQNNFEAADHFLESLEEQFNLLAEQPMAGRSRNELVPGLRSFPVGNYIVFYRFREDVVEIARVLNAARDVEVIFRER